MTIKEIIKHLLDGWKDDTHWLHYHHKNDPQRRQQSDGFPDSPHHMGFFVTALFFLNKFKTQNTSWFIRGWKVRNLAPTHFMRHPRTGEENDPRKRWNRDQLTPILYPLAQKFLSKRAYLTYDIVRKSAPWWEFLQPHHLVHFQLCLNEPVKPWLRFIADLFEIGDTVIDIWNKRKAKVFADWPFSSIVKTIYRNVIALEVSSTKLAQFNQRLIAKYLEPQKAFEGYFTRKHHHSDQPPPIHLLWEPILKEYYND